MSDLRRKHGEDTIELLEKGDRYDEDGADEGEDKGGPLTLRDKKALTLLVVLCKRRLLSSCCLVFSS